MLSNHQVGIFKHSLGAGVVLCIYAAQVCHLCQFVEMGLFVFTYLFALLAYYCILYGCESRLFRLVTRESRRLYNFLKVLIIIVNVFFSVSGYFVHGFSHAQPIGLVVLKCLVFLFLALFPEVVLPLIFNIQHAEK